VEDESISRAEPARARRRRPLQPTPPEPRSSTWSASGASILVDRPGQKKIVVGTSASSPTGARTMPCWAQIDRDVDLGVE